MQFLDSITTLATLLNERKVSSCQVAIYNRDNSSQHLRRRWPEIKYLDKELHTDIINHDRANNRDCIAN